MQQLLTGQTRLPGFHGEWEVKRLGEVAHIKTGSRNNEDKVEDGQYPFYVRSEIVERITDRCTEVETGARNIDHILRGTVLPLMSRELLGRMGKGALPSEVRLSVAEDGSFRVDFEETGNT